MSVLKTACVQISAGLDDAANLARLEAMIGEAVAGGARFVALPEYCGCYGMAEGRLEVGAVAEAEHASLKALRDRAAAHAIWLLIGSLGVRAPDGRIANRSFLVNPEGAVAARYDKIHLFDVDLAGGESYRESADVAPGDRAVLADLDGTGLGLSICYDLRFARLYRSLAKAGASILSVPAAFTRKTGRAHWHVLLRARAIETGSFVVAPAQCGDAPDGRLQRYGHSLIVAPWGEVLADAGPEEGVVMAELDLARVIEARRMVPALRHDRPFTGPEAALSSLAAE